MIPRKLFVNCLACITTVLLCSVPTTEASWFRIRGGTVTTAVTVQAPYDLVTIENVIFDGAGASLYVDLNTMMATPPTTALVVQFCSCTIRNGAAVYFVGRTSPASTAANSRPLRLIVLGLTMSNGGMLFANEFPYNSRVTIVQPRITMDTTKPQPTYARFLSAANIGSLYCTFVFSNIRFRNGFFFVYDTFAYGGTRQDNVVTFYSQSTFTLDQSFMFAINLMSVSHGLFFLSLGTMSINSYSVMIFESVEGFTCGTACVEFRSALSVTSYSAFALSNCDLEANSVAFRFASASATSSSWFGIMGNILFLTTAVAGYPSGSASTSSDGTSASSVSNNLYDQNWFQSCSGRAYDQCNNYRSGYATNRIPGSTSRDCDPNPMFLASCHPAFASGMSGTRCICTAAGYGKYCIPQPMPTVLSACVKTDTQTVTISDETLTIAFTSSMSASDEPTDEQTLTWSKEESLTSSESASFTPSDFASLTGSESTTLSDFLSSTVTHEITATQTETASFSGMSLSPTTVSEEISTTGSRTNDFTSTETISDYLSVTNTQSDDPSTSETEMQTLSESYYDTATPMLSPSKSLSLSSCEWLVVQLNCTYPLTPIIGPDFTRTGTLFNPSPFIIQENDTDTMEIPYLPFFADGANFSFMDLGQWFLWRMNWTGETDGLIFTPVILPKYTDEDWRAANPTYVMVHMEPGPVRYNPELYRSVTFEALLRCAVTNVTKFYQVHIVPHPAVLSAAESELAMRAAMLVSVALTVPAASSICALALTLQQLFLCQPQTESTQFDVTRLEIGDDEIKMLRGAVVGNFAVVVGQLLIMFFIAIAGVIWNLRIGDITAWDDFRRIFRLLQFPTSLHVTASAMLQLLMAAAVALFKVSTAYEDILLGAGGVLVCFSYTILICHRAVQIYLERRGNFLKSFKLPIMVLPREEDNFLYGEYDMPWYAGLETITLLLIGTASGTPTLRPYDCTSQLWAVVFLSLVSMVVLLVLRPMRTMVGQVGALLLRVLTIVMCGCAIVMATSVPEQIRAQNGAAVCLLLMVCIGLLRAVVDVKRLYIGFPRLMRQIFRLKEPEPKPEPLLAFEPPVEDELYWDAEKFEVSSSSSEEEFVPQALKETEAVGFMGHGEEEIDDTDDLVRAYRNRKPLTAKNKANFDLEALLKGEMPPPPPSSSSSSDDEVLVRRHAPPANMQREQSSSDSDGDSIDPRTASSPVENPFRNIGALDSFRVPPARPGGLQQSATAKKGTGVSKSLSPTSRTPSKGRAQLSPTSPDEDVL